MNSRYQHAILAVLACAGVWLALTLTHERKDDLTRSSKAELPRESRVEAPATTSLPMSSSAPWGRDTRYQGTTTFEDGGATVQTKGPPMVHRLNDLPYEQALASLEKGDFKQAEKTLRAIVEKTPDELPAQHALATTLFLQKRYEESKATFEKILDFDPKFFAARGGLGAVARALGDLPEAVAQYSMAIQGEPDSALFFAGRGKAHYRMNKVVEARADFNRVLELLPPGAVLAIDAKQYLDKLTGPPPP